MEYKAINIEKIKDEFKRNKIKCIEAVSDVFGNMPTIAIIEPDEYIELAKELNIKNVFFQINHYNIEDYFIRYDNVKDKYDRKILELVEPEIFKYNDEVSCLNFNRPMELDLLFIHEGVVYTYFLYDDWINDLEGCYKPDIMIEAIISNHSKEIEEMIEKEEEKLIREREKNCKEIEKLKLDLENKILNDRDFTFLSNMKLRNAYARKLIQSDEFKKYKKCFEDENGYFNHHEVINWIEVLWKRRLK